MAVSRNVRHPQLTHNAAGGLQLRHRLSENTFPQGDPLSNSSTKIYTVYVFTGIVEKTARVIGIADGPNFRRLNLAVDWTDIALGQSVAVNGCCLTIARISPGEIGFDVIEETLNRTNLGLLSTGDDVNLERSLRVGDRLDGHFVQGHIDGVGKLIDSRANPGERRLTIEAPASLCQFLIPKGSITVDGISLTLAGIRENFFEVALIPTTMQLTTIARKSIGWPYNLEMDILSKTMVSWLDRQKDAGRV
jgi:riboflavin synthase